MPELPEVQTVVNGLNRKVLGKIIKSVWKDYEESNFYKGKENIKDKKFFKFFSKEVSGQKILKAERRAKNILIHLKNKKTILIHLKMTGHLVFGDYKFNNKKKIFEPDGGFFLSEDLRNDIDGRILKEIKRNPLKDPFNRFIHFAVSFTDGKVLILSDMRKFASVSLKNTKNILEFFSNIGPEPFELSPSEFCKISKRKTGKIKTILMNPEFIAGIGNIYSDEILWKVGIHPESEISSIPSFKLKEIIKYTKKILKKSILMGGDSMSDFRNIDGVSGNFHKYHNCYKLEKMACKKKDCGGIIEKKDVGSRTARFCKTHQKVWQKINKKQNKKYH